MRGLPDTLASRLVLTLLASLVVFHLGSIYLYQIGIRHAADTAHEEQLAERLVSIKRSISEQPKARREATAHDLSTAALDVHWSEVGLVNDVPVTSPELSIFRERLLAALPGELSNNQIRLGYADEGVANKHSPYNSHIMLVSLGLRDGSWANFAVSNMAPSAEHDHGTILSTTLMALGVILVSLVVVRWFNRPLENLATAAQRLGHNIHAPPLAESGPREVRQAAQAFNSMQAALQQMMRERSLALAAISHDLRTPLTRIRLRAEFIGDAELRTRTEQDILEMQALIDSALAYLRDEHDTSPPQTMDLAALLGDISRAFEEMGHMVTTDLPEKCLFQGRELVLRRAFSNLIDNAIKYGQRADIRLRSESGHYVVEISDQGPGIPVQEQTRVLQPFYQIDNARSSSKGGSGLGLSVADLAIKRHGGSLTFVNLPEGGLRATVRLPHLSAPA